MKTSRLLSTFSARKLVQLALNKNYLLFCYSWTLIIHLEFPVILKNLELFTSELPFGHLQFVLQASLNYFSFPFRVQTSRVHLYLVSRQLARFLVYQASENDKFLPWWENLLVLNNHMTLLLALVQVDINVFLHISAFGFCDYGDPEASLRAIRLLHTKVLGDKALVVSKLLFICKSSDSYNTCTCILVQPICFTPCVNSHDYSFCIGLGCQS